MANPTPSSIAIGDSLRPLFLLDPTIAFLNHGSFGACPKPVFETYQRWQLELERQPVEFLGRRFHALLDEARGKLAGYVNADADNIVFVPNATAGINTAARSISLKSGDEILTTDQEYGAMNYTWQHNCALRGARTIEQPIALPVNSVEEVVEQFWAGVTPRTKVIFLSHITSGSALILPVREIIRRAQATGIITVIDGAHAPGHIPVDLRALDADFYAGNCHKWLCAPKGSGFLYARPEFHQQIEPPSISWGWADGDSLVNRMQQQGTRDIAAFLSVPAAIEFQRAHHWDAVRAACHALASDLRERLSELSGLPPLSPDSPEWYAQMFTAPLPACDAEVVKRRLYDEYGVEVPVMERNGGQQVRVSIQGYNTPADAARLLDGLTAILSL